MKKELLIELMSLFTISFLSTGCSDTNDIVSEPQANNTEVVAEDTSTSDVSELNTDVNTDTTVDTSDNGRTSNQDGKLIERLKENFWWAEVEWPRSPLWEEHQGESCVQVCDMFFTDNMTYEEIYDTVMNSKLKDDILANGIKVCAKPGSKFIKDIPKTYEEWETCTDEFPITNIVFNLSKEDYSVINLGTDDDPQMVYLGTHQYYIETAYRSTGAGGRNDFRLPYTIRNDVNVKASLDPEDEKYNPMMKAILRYNKDIETEPMNIEEFFSDYDSLPEWFKEEKTAD